MDFFEGSTDGEKTYQIQGLCALLYFEWIPSLKSEGAKYLE